jgi:SAM-dependent methyltransferase
MKRTAYAVEDAIEEHHWWFAGRRRLFARELRCAGITDDARILDIGTSTGTNLRLLRELGLTRVTGLDISEDAIRFCRDKGLGHGERGEVRGMSCAG